ncbi:MAG: hypothetical protein U9N54_11480 [candidate division Zixibacteria bacterium]|nr:hypothetical protein [candidate division Zixibacteria bacterium]
MKRWLLFTLLVLVSASFLVCTETKIVTNDDNNNSHPINPVFDIDCIGNTNAAVTQTIQADIGGSITTTSANNVNFTLTIPAYSLANDTDITLTPLDSFDLSGPFSIACVDTSGGSDICFEGIICEPSGLMFDSGATLTVEFPVGQPFPFDSSTTITFFDTSNAVFYIYPTTIDPVNRLLICTLNHFSGYVTNTVPYMTVEDLCAILYSSFDNLKIAANNSIRSADFVSYVVQIIELKASNHYTNSGEPNPNLREIECPNFNEMIDAQIYTLITHHWSVLHEIWTEGGIDYIPSMISDHQSLYRMTPYITNPNAQYALEQILREMRLFINERLREYANQGHTLCQTNYEPDCNTGSEILSEVLAYGGQGYVVTSGLVVDEAYLQQVENWLDDCCTEDIYAKLTVPVTTTIHRLAINPDNVYADPYAYVCSLNVKVTGARGTPLESVPVQLWRVGQSYKIAAKSTDENGNSGFIIEPRSINFACQEFVTQTFYAKAYNANTETWSEPTEQIPVMFLNTMIETTISYLCDWADDSFGSSMTATVEGTGSAPISDGGICSNSCSSELTRTYSYNSCNHEGSCLSGTSIDENPIHACRAVGDIRTLLLEGTGKRVDFLYGARVSLGSWIFVGLVVVNSNGSIDTLHNGVGASVWPEEQFYFPAPDEGNIGIIGDTTWTWDSSGYPNAIGTKTVTYRVKVKLVE